MSFDRFPFTDNWVYKVYDLGPVHYMKFYNELTGVSFIVTGFSFKSMIFQAIEFVTMELDSMGA